MYVYVYTRVNLCTFDSVFLKTIYKKKYVISVGNYVNLLSTLGVAMETLSKVENATAFMYV